MARPGRHPSPTAAFQKRSLAITRVPKSHRWVRLHRSKYPPLHFGTTGLSRFDAPDGSFGVLYVARQPKGAFAETFCRHGGALHQVYELELEQYAVAAITSNRSLKLADLAGKGLARMGLDNRLSTGDYRIAQRWAAAIYNHPDQPDGIIYSSRHDPKQQLAALFDRSKSLLRVQKLGTLRSHLGDREFFELLDHYGIALL